MFPVINMNNLLLDVPIMNMHNFLLDGKQQTINQ